MTTRRGFLRVSGGAGALAALGDLGFLDGLPAVTAGEARIHPGGVRLEAGIEPWVRLLEVTPRNRVLEEVAAGLRRGLTYRELVAALLLAGVRGIQPRPVGFKFHAVLVVHSAHLASLSSPPGDRWLPIFWAIDQFKSSQEADEREGDWTMGELDESRVPPPHRAREAFVEAMDRWDEEGADAAVVGWARVAGAHEMFDVFARYGVRDFRDIGHKAIYVANGFRTLEAIGWQHAEPVLRSLAYALLDRGGDRVNPARADLSGDRPFRRSVERLGEMPDGRSGVERDDGATEAFLDAARSATPDEMTSLAVGMANRGLSPESVFDGCLAGAGELLMRAPGILSLHAVTFTNAVRYAWRQCGNEETRRLLMLQNAAFLPLYRRTSGRAELRIDRLEPSPTASGAEEGLEEIFAAVGSDPGVASRKVLDWLGRHGDPAPLAQAARRLIFLKGRNSHDYKFSSAVLEDHETMGRRWRDPFLASSVYSLRGSLEADNPLVRRTRAALDGLG